MTDVITELVELFDAEGAFIFGEGATSAGHMSLLRAHSPVPLNKPLPADLLREVRHFDAIEVNTYVCRGLRDGELVPVPNAESDMAIAPVSYTANFLQDPPESAKQQRDDKRSSSVIVLSAQSEYEFTHGPRKCRHREVTSMELTEDDIPSHADSGNTSSVLGSGCTWTEADWSWNCQMHTFSFIWGRNQGDINQHCTIPSARRAERGKTTSIKHSRGAARAQNAEEVENKAQKISQMHREDPCLIIIFQYLGGMGPLSVQVARMDPISSLRSGPTWKFFTEGKPPREGECTTQ
ncbi:hypothetical protein EV702DRAFT_1045343 [Suillus placidus]|uniref:Uncharacterized protein n=1 Tax=Suillus placidus TaxID=48579 RepID=A0A9P7D3Z6_9AGAM|nr:hypothetical protein EV702DRAFT_1045343 [Suillus placidus]